jgi:hypothetical protein
MRGCFCSLWSGNEILINCILIQIQFAVINARVDDDPIRGGKPAGPSSKAERGV